MDSATSWRQLFAKWPQGLEHRGVLVTSYNEQIVFVEYLLSEHMIMLERQAPDSVGGRKVLLPYSKIEAVKIIDPVGNEVFTSSGFTAVGPRQAGAK